MKNHIVQKDLKQDDVLPLQPGSQDGATVGTDSGVTNAIKAKAPGKHANAQIKSQPGSQGTVDMSKHNK